MAWTYKNLSSVQDAAVTAELDKKRQAALKEAEDKRLRDIEAQKQSLANASKSGRDSTAQGNKPSTLTYALPTVEKDYPEGISEETISEGNRTIFRTIIKLATKQEVYSKVVYSYGTFFFKDNSSITESTYVSDIKRAKEKINNK